MGKTGPHVKFVRSWLVNFLAMTSGISSAGGSLLHIKTTVFTLIEFISVKVSAQSIIFAFIVVGTLEYLVSIVFVSTFGSNDLQLFTLLTINHLFF